MRSKPDYVEVIFIVCLVVVVIVVVIIKPSFKTWSKSGH